MARLGELLVAAGLLTIEQVEHALRAQVMWGGRLGTNLIELGFLDLDKLAHALGRQHGLPAALGRHFEQADPGLQHKLSVELAERHACVPLLRAGPGKAQVIIAGIGPLARTAIAMIADDLEVAPKQIVMSVAGELRVRYHLELVYRIRRGARFLRPRGKTIPPFPHFDIDPLAFEDSQVDNVLEPGGTSPAAPPPAPIATELDPPTVPRAAKKADADESLDDVSLAEVREALKARLDERAALAPDDVSDRTLPMRPMQLEPEPAAHADADELLDDEELLDDDHSVIAALDELADLDAASVPEPVARDESSGRERRSYVRTIDSEPSTDSERQSLGRIAIRKVAAVGAAHVEAPVVTGATLGEATRAIRRSQDRDHVAELVMDTLFRFAMSCEAAIILVVRGDAAMSWKGFSRSGAPLAEIAVPMDQPGLVPRVIETNQTARARCTDLGPIDQLLLISLAQQAGELVVVPVSIGGQVMSVIALVCEPGSAVATAESIAAAAGAAFARLMRYASR